MHFSKNDVCTQLRFDLISIYNISWIRTFYIYGIGVLFPVETMGCVTTLPLSRVTMTPEQ